MSLNALTMTYPWARYSKKLKDKILLPRNVGKITPEDAKERGMRHAQGEGGSIEDGNFVRLYWFIDPDDGKIVDCKFQVYGQSALIGAAEAACEVLVGKNYDQARRLSADLIDREVRDKSDTPAFPWETASHLNLVIDAIEEAAETCTDIPLPTNYAAPPAPADSGEILEGGYPGWDALSNEQKLHLLEEILDQDIRPYIALDAGGVTVKSLEGNALTIAYQGACTSCISSVGATLSYIQQTLRNKAHPDLQVIPDVNL